MEGINFDDISQRVKDVAGDLQKKAADTIDVGRIRNQIHSLERENDRAFTELGKMVYTKYQEDGQTEDDYTEICAGISDREKQIADQQSQIDAIKGE